MGVTKKVGQRVRHTKPHLRPVAACMRGEIESLNPLVVRWDDGGTAVQNPSHLADDERYPLVPRWDRRKQRTVYR